MLHILLCIIGLSLASPVFARGVTWNPKSGPPTGVQVKVGPVHVSAQLTTPANDWPDKCGQVKPADFNAPAASIGYRFVPPGNSGRRRSGQTYGGGGYFNTEESRTARIFVQTYGPWNVRRVIVEYNGRTQSKAGAQLQYSDTFGGSGYSFTVGGLNGVRVLFVTVRYEDVGSRYVGERTDCITIAGPGVN